MTQSSNDKIAELKSIQVDVNDLINNRHQLTKADKELRDDITQGYKILLELQKKIKEEESDLRGLRKRTQEQHSQLGHQQPHVIMEQPHQQEEQDSRIRREQEWERRN